ncbi:hypothetical protein J2T57_004450 [Natronocella acetinitrilica]|uniref:Uncharacterized protein n=1 Tax=Natronocella acetinitrilica TaxID=414046 RepID=A0AAE3KDT8_9GAMM|nr:hypothetical protein [Natronocella acetinitrilica]MCP1677271.1 hypothetical protein [Natronocella acetinitrilica]
MNQQQNTLSASDFIEATGGETNSPETIQLILGSITDDTKKVFSSLHRYILGFDPSIRYRSTGPCAFEYGMPKPQRWRPLIARLDLTSDGISIAITNTCSDPWDLFEPAGQKWQTLRNRVSFDDITSDLLEYLKYRLSESYTNSTGKAGRTTGTLASLLEPDSRALNRPGFGGGSNS